MKRVLLYLDTNKVANPFDLLLALDADYDVVLPYAGINEENVDSIIYNAVFARKREGLDNTIVLVGGGLEESEKVFQKLKRLLRDPFKISVIWDPNGACTTAAAAVAKIENLAGSLKGKNVTILAGTGPVGQISAILMRNQGANVTITSRTKDKADKIASKLSDDIRGRVVGAKGAVQEERCEACKEANIILAAGAIGAQLLDSKGLRELNPEVVADVNAVKPYGVEGIDPDMNGDSMGNAKGLGPCTIGDLKNAVEKKLLQKALEEVKTYDYNDALIIAKELSR